MQNWKVVTNPIKNRLSVDTGEEGMITPGEGLQRSAEHDQMAYLIAAAPDLLAALEELLSVCVEELDPARTPEMKQARAAIAKAKGQQ